MLQFLRRRWLLLTIVAVLLVAGILLALLRDRIIPAATHEEVQVPEKPEAPPDLEKFREAYASGLKAIQQNDGAEAVKNFSSFTFGSRAVEEYRLYYLANGYQLTGDDGAARATLARLWQKNPRLIYAPDAGFNLANLYVSAAEFDRAADVYARIAERTAEPSVSSAALWNEAGSRFNAGDIAAALAAARRLIVAHPKAEEAGPAIALIRAIHGLDENAAIPMSPEERLERATSLIRDGDAQDGLDELGFLEPSAPAGLKLQIQLQRGVALNRLRRYEDSNKVLEPLTSVYFKYAIPALYTASKNYSIVSNSINPIVFKTVKEKKQVGTVKVRVGKGKKRKTVTKPKFAVVAKQIKLIDLAKKNKKDEYDRLSVERLKDLLALPIEPQMRLDVLNSLAARAESKNQDEYLMELVPQIIKLDALADPALQHFWDKGWAAYARGDLPTAQKLFHFISATYTNPNVRRQADYWYARSAERRGAKDEARGIYQRLASSPYADLYALHSVARGAKRQENTTSPLGDGGADWREIAEKNMPAELRLAYELTALQDMKAAFEETRHNARPDNVRFAEALFADYYNSVGNELLMYRSVRKAWPQLATPEQDTVPDYFIKMYYPVHYVDAIRKYSKKQGVDPSLVQALILQESYYNPEAKSRVGATGLMQLMPPTAREIAQRLHVPFGDRRLTNPEVNIELGTYHLKMLVNMFNGNPYLAVASYNGGQGNVLKWRRAAPGKPLDEFIESIPFPETRNYVKRLTMLKSAYARITPP
ncbi:MAG TPA: lytic transglycosylase domain-containing protein [Thermoanaerobaculia bacterium]|nr:lytic transglycosylase domain-containing protein [Thermoanaerobaculia bacterium]